MTLPSSFFVSDALHERDVTLADGTVHKMYFREVPAVQFKRFVNDEASSDEDRRAESMARLVVASLCTADGKPAITLGDARRLKVDPLTSLFKAALEVNRAQEQEKND